MVSNWDYKSYETGTSTRTGTDALRMQSVSHSNFVIVGTTQPTHTYSLQLGWWTGDIDADKQRVCDEIESTLAAYNPSAELLEILQDQIAL